jgi:hypothetical protein
MTEPTPEQYEAFGAAVCGIMDGFLTEPEPEGKEALVVEMLKLAAQACDIILGEDND